MAERDCFASCYVVKIDVLFSLFVRIGIVENPPIARQVSAVSVFCHNTFADDLDSFCAVPRFRGDELAPATAGVQIKSVTVRRVPGPGQNMLRISPDKMRCFSIRIDYLYTGAIGPGC